MQRRLQSLLIGVAVAGFTIAPSTDALTQTPPQGEQQIAPRDFAANAVRLNDIVGTLVVNVRPSGPMTVEVSGDKQRVEGVHVAQHDGRVAIEGFGSSENNTSVWDWRNWFNFSHDNWRRSGNLTVTLWVPRGADIDVNDLVGHAVIGDTYGRLRFEAAATKAEIGHVSSAKISLGGSGQVTIAQVDQTLDLELGGAGKVFAGPTGSVHARIAGSGDAQLGPIAQGLSLEIAGSGDVAVQHVNGPTRIEIAGSGRVRIADGIADPLHVAIMGAGNLYFGGVAVDPRIEAVGSGTVHIKAYRGRLDSEGMADVTIGD